VPFTTCLPAISLDFVFWCDIGIPCIPTVLPAWMFCSGSFSVMHFVRVYLPAVSRSAFLGAFLHRSLPLHFVLDFCVRFHVSVIPHLRLRFVSATSPFLFLFRFCRRACRMRFLRITVSGSAAATIPPAEQTVFVSGFWSTVSVLRLPATEHYTWISAACLPYTCTCVCTVLLLRWNLLPFITACCLEQCRRACCNAGFLCLGAAVRKRLTPAITVFVLSRFADGFYDFTATCVLPLHHRRWVIRFCRFLPFTILCVSLSCYLTTGFLWIAGRPAI